MCKTCVSICFYDSALKGAFDDIDVDGTGTISKSELRTALQLIGQNPTAEEMATYMEGEGYSFDISPYIC